MYPVMSDSEIQWRKRQSCLYHHICVSEYKIYRKEREKRNSKSGREGGRERKRERERKKERKGRRKEERRLGEGGIIIYVYMVSEKKLNLLSTE